MGRRKPAWLQQKEADIAKAREQYYASKQHSNSTTVASRPINTAVYKSLLIQKAGTAAAFEVKISKHAQDFFGGLSALGLVAVSQDATDVISSKPRGFKPAQVHAMVGGTTPTAHVTAWGSRVIKYSAATAGTSQAYYQAPISSGDNSPTQAEIQTKASTIFNAKKGELGNQDYARFYVTPEVSSISLI